MPESDYHIGDFAQVSADTETLGIHFWYQCNFSYATFFCILMLFNNAEHSHIELDRNSTNVKILQT